jgi:CRP-like cAMP-binding protein
VTSSQLEVFPLLHELSEGERDDLAELLEHWSFKEGEEIFCEGDEAHGLVLVLSGSVRLEGSRGEAAERITQGEHLGALSLVAVGSRESSAVAESACDLLLFSRTAFRRLADDAPRAACRLVEAILVDLAGLLRGDLDHIATLDSRAEISRGSSSSA